MDSEPIENFLRCVAIPAIEPDYGDEIAEALVHLETAMSAHGFTTTAKVSTSSGKGSQEIPDAGWSELVLKQRIDAGFY